MNLLVKFNLIFIVVLGAGLAVASISARTYLREAARNESIQDARMMLETTLATRDYTQKQIRPLLQTLQRRDHTFYAQSVPSYSALQVLNFLHNDYPGYGYREATLNPTNPSDRAVDWETDVVQYFRNDKSQKEMWGTRDTPKGPSLYLARPLVARQECLECHGVPRSAPAAMLAAYGSNNGFGWKVDEVIGARIVSIPMALSLAVAADEFRKLMIWSAGFTIAVLALLNVGLYFVVVRPVTAMSSAAEAISKGNFGIPELPANGRDEISRLAASFNLIRRSLEKAMGMLKKGPGA
jgi:protein-histidine pros-kinase